MRSAAICTRVSVRQYRLKLRELTHDLEAAREADVTRRAISQLQKEGRAGIRIEADALRGEVAEGYRRPCSVSEGTSPPRPGGADCRACSACRYAHPWCRSTVNPQQSPSIRPVNRARRRLRLALRPRRQKRQAAA
jgi:hypothetical protein